MKATVKANANLTVGKGSRPLQYEYKHILHEPLMLQFNMLIQSSGRNNGYIAQMTGITTQTLRNWQLRRTKRPNSSTLRMAFKALGYSLKPIKE